MRIAENKSIPVGLLDPVVSPPSLGFFINEWVVGEEHLQRRGDSSLRGYEGRDEAEGDEAIPNPQSAHTQAAPTHVDVLTNEWVVGEEHLQRRGDSSLRGYEGRDEAEGDETIPRLQRAHVEATPVHVSVLINEWVVGEEHRQRLVYPEVLWAILILLFSVDGYSQDKIPDGTQGEELEVVDADSLPDKWKDKRWRLFPGRFTTLKFGGGFLYEFAGFSQDQDGKRQTDSIGTPLENKFSVRDFRVTASGQLRTKRIINWKVGIMYDGPSRSWFIRESGIMIDVPELWGKFFIGRTKEGFSMNKVMVGYAGWAPERQMAIDVIPILADGVKWLGFLPKQRILWNLGVYNDLTSSSQSFSTFAWQFAARVGWLPVYVPAERKVLHLAMNYRYGEPVNGAIRVSSRPETNEAPKFIDTGKFSADYSDHIGGEAYFNSGPLMIGTEMYWHRFNSVTADDPEFFGGEIVVSYMITGESRPYNTATGILGFVPINKSVFKSGPGAWEVAVRATTLDLNGGTITGGKFWRITPMVNWYLNKDIRLEFAYGYGVLDRYTLNGVTQFFQARVQFTLL